MRQEDRAKLLEILMGERGLMKPAEDGAVIRKGGAFSTKEIHRDPISAPLLRIAQSWMLPALGFLADAEPSDSRKGETMRLLKSFIMADSSCQEASNQTVSPHQSVRRSGFGNSNALFPPGYYAMEGFLESRDSDAIPFEAKEKLAEEIMEDGIARNMHRMLRQSVSNNDVIELDGAREASASESEGGAVRHQIIFWYAVFWLAAENPKVKQENTDKARSFINEVRGGCRRLW